MSSRKSSLSAKTVLGYTGLILLAIVSGIFGSFVSSSKTVGELTQAELDSLIAFPISIAGNQVIEFGVIDSFPVTGFINDTAWVAQADGSKLPGKITPKQVTRIFPIDTVEYWSIPQIATAMKKSIETSNRQQAFFQQKLLDSLNVRFGF